MPSVDLRRTRPSPGTAERRRSDLQEHQRAKSASTPSWSASLAAGGLADGRGIHGSLSEADRINKEAMRKISGAQVILGKVRRHFGGPRVEYWQRADVDVDVFLFRLNDQKHLPLILSLPSI